MERNFYTDRFEQLLKEKSDEFRMVPSKRVWYSLYNDLHPGRTWPSLAMGMMLVIILLLVGYLNNYENSVIKVNDLAGSPESKGKTGNNEVSQFALLNTVPLPGNSTFVSIPGAWPSITSTNKSSLTAVIDPLVNDFTTGYASASNVRKAGDDHSIVENINNYINSGILFSELAMLKKGAREKNSMLTGLTDFSDSKQPDSDEPLRILTTADPVSKIPYTNFPVASENNTGNIVPRNNLSTAATTTKNSVSAEDRAWMDDFAMHNKSGRQKWKDKLSMEIYATPNVGYRSLTSNIQNGAQSGNLSAATGSGINNEVRHNPGIGMEAGLGLSYSVTRSILLKAGAQLNYTSYSINADQTNHPILTSLLLNGPNNGNPFLSATTSTYSNSSQLQPVTLHNTTFQVSLPVGIAIKLAGNQNLGWYAGATLQPTVVMGGTANLISSDYKNYVSDASLIRRWNMNTGFETYVNYKIGAYTLKVGPQFRYQLLSTYDSKYTFSEKLYNAGLKVGLVKGF